MSGETKINSMGAIPHTRGVGFRVWAPNARRVSVIGSFNGWGGGKHPMQAEENGHWYAFPYPPVFYVLCWPLVRLARFRPEVAVAHPLVDGPPHG